MFRCNNLRKEKYFPNFFFVHFLNLDSIRKFIKKMTLTADAFLNLRTPKDVVREMSKKCRFRRPLDK